MANEFVIAEKTFINPRYHSFIRYYFIRKRELLLQKRSILKDAFPGAWDISSAGHVDAGEKCDDAAARELTEELGVTELLKYTTIDFLFETRINCAKNDGKVIDNEFVNVYGVWVNDDALEHHLHFKLQETEVDEVRWVPVKELRQKYLEHDPSYACTIGPEQINFIFDNLERYMDKKLQESV